MLQSMCFVVGVVVVCSVISFRSLCCGILMLVCFYVSHALVAVVVFVNRAVVFAITVCRSNFLLHPLCFLLRLATPMPRYLLNAYGSSHPSHTHTHTHTHTDRRPYWR